LLKKEQMDECEVDQLTRLNQYFEQVFQSKKTDF
jgi:hypothetical protein